MAEQKSGTVSIEVERTQLESWKGRAAHAYRIKNKQVVTMARDVAVLLGGGFSTLRDYAAALELIQGSMSQAEEETRAAKAKVEATPVEDVETREAAVAAWYAAADAESRILVSTQSLADEAAERLLHMIGLSGQFWWMQGADELTPDLPVDEATKNNTDWSGASVAQGGIGDCGFISTLKGYMRTEEGRAILEENVQWDAEKKGYWVTLYVEGEPKKYFVDKVHEDGAGQVDANGERSPNIVSLYEAALGQATKMEGVDGEKSMELISGMPTKSVSPDEQGVAEAKRAFDSGSPVVAGTRGDAEILDGVTVEKADGKTEVTSVYIIEEHAYTVERIDPDGSVWVRNPWGPNNPADRGDLIKLTPEQLALAFSNLDMEE
jgi:hypothetical protein